MTDPAQRIQDLVEIHALCSRYMLYTSQFVKDRWLDVFTPDVEYKAFGTPYTIERFPDPRLLGVLPVDCAPQIPLLGTPASAPPRDN